MLFERTATNEPVRAKKVLDPCRTSLFRARGHALYCLLILAAMLCWPAILNRSAFLFPDTATYVRGADAAVFKLTGYSSEWSEELFKRYRNAAGFDTTRSHIASQQSAGEDHVVLAGRSIYYGGFVYVADQLAGLWLAVLVQALLLAGALLAATNRILGHAPFSRPQWRLLVLPFVSGIAFFTSMIMPDFTTPLAVLAVAMIAVYWPAMQTRERAGWSALLALSLVVHTANLILAAALALCVALVLVWKRMRMTRLWPILAMIGVGFVSEAAFTAAVRMQTGNAPVRPPFVFARLIADGPAYAYLRRTCPSGNNLLACRYLNRMPAPHNALLWSKSDHEGIFTALPPSEKRQIAKEERQILLSTIAYDPVGVIRASSLNTAHQLFAIGLSTFNMRNIELSRLPPKLRRSYDQSAAANHQMPVRFFGALSFGVLMASLAALTWLIFFQGSNRLALEHQVMIGLVLMGVIANAAITGALSGPEDRYQARIIWLVPFLAIVLMKTREGILGSSHRR